jgi:hypothetical protein
VLENERLRLVKKTSVLDVTNKKENELGEEAEDPLVHIRESDAHSVHSEAVDEVRVARDVPMVPMLFPLMIARTDPVLEKLVE